MGVTVSHTSLAPISLASTIIGFVSFAFTLATFLNVFWSALLTIYGAPGQINDYLSNLKQGLLEERRHLRRVRRRMKSIKRDTSHGRGRSRSDDDPASGGGRRKSWGRGSSQPDRRRRGKDPMHFDRDVQAAQSTGEEASLESMRIAIRDMIREFRRIEYPFLKPEFQNRKSSEWSTSAPYPYTPEKSTYRSPYYHGKERDEDEEEYPGSSGLQQSNRLGFEYRKCGFRERWLWLRRKNDVISLSEGLSRVEVRRTAHEVGEVLMMVGDVGRDMEDVRQSILALEGRMSRVVGIRRVD